MNESQAPHLTPSRRDLLKVAAGAASTATLSRLSSAAERDAPAFIDAYTDALSYQSGDRVRLQVSTTAFEFSIVSTIPVGAELIPGAAGRGIGALLVAGTVGRMAVAVPATRLYESHGFGAPALVAAGSAALAGVAMRIREKLVR